jgi:hypothetical protein
MQGKRDGESEVPQFGFTQHLPPTFCVNLLKDEFFSRLLCLGAAKRSETSGPTELEIFMNSAAPFLLSVFCALLAVPAQAQTAPEPQGLSMELNATAETENGCMMTFVVESGLGSDISKASYQMVFFNGEGLVERMTVLDFQDVPAGRTRVRQFNIGGAACSSLSRVLVNDVATCESDDLPADACIVSLAASSRSDIELSN